MDQKKRIIIGLVILAVIVGVILGGDWIQRRSAARDAPNEMPPGSIPIYVNGEFLTSFVPDDLDQLGTASFVDDEEGKTQAGWLLRDVLILYVEDEFLEPETKVTVSSSTREKTATLKWEDVIDENNLVLFDLSSRSTLKLVSNIPGFDIRDTWVQDTDKIEVIQP